MVRVLAWKPAWDTIMFVNSCASSTLDISDVPELMVPRDPVPGVPRTRCRSSPRRCSCCSPALERPEGFGKVASASCATSASGRLSRCR